MKRSIRPALAALFCGVFSAATPPAAQAEFKCDGRPLIGVDARACAQAAQGAESLRRFVTRTEKIYGLQMKDYVRFVGDEPLPPQVRVAPAALATKPASVAGVAPPSR